MFPLLFCLTSLSFVFSLLAMYICVRAIRSLRPGSAAAWSELLLRVGEWSSHCEALQASLQRLNSRVAMRELRERRRGSSDASDADPPIDTSSREAKLNAVRR